MVQLVAQPTALWDKFLRLLTGDYHVPKINKEGKTHLVKGPLSKPPRFSSISLVLMVKGFLRCRTYAEHRGGEVTAGIEFKFKFKFDLFFRILTWDISNKEIT